MARHSLSKAALQVFRAASFSVLDHGMSLNIASLLVYPLSLYLRHYLILRRRVRHEAPILQCDAIIAYLARSVMGGAYAPSFNGKADGR